MRHRQIYTGFTVSILKTKQKTNQIAEPINRARRDFFSIKIDLLARTHARTHGHTHTHTTHHTPTHTHTHTHTHTCQPDAACMLSTMLTVCTYVCVCVCLCLCLCLCLCVCARAHLANPCNAYCTLSSSREYNMTHTALDAYSHIVLSRKPQRQSISQQHGRRRRRAPDYDMMIIYIHM
jgi:hypothetical protein